MPPKGCLLYGPPGTGKTLLAKAVSKQLDANFLKVVSSAIVDKYIGESARLIREMFGELCQVHVCSACLFIGHDSLSIAYARDHQPCIIFMDEIDAIGGKRFSEGTSADREIQRTLMELLNQMDGFDKLGQVKMIMATNRPDVLDPALLRPGRLDRKIGRFSACTVCGGYTYTVHVCTCITWKCDFPGLYTYVMCMHNHLVWVFCKELYMHVG